MTGKARFLSFLTLIALRVWLQAADGQPEWTVLYGHEEFRNADKMLSDYIGKLRSAAEAEREKVIRGLSTPSEMSKYQADTRARLQTIVGDFPARTPLNARIVGRLDRGDYVVENLIFESRPRYYVTANVYVPRRAQNRFPAVLAPVGHWGAGKFFEDYQRLGAYLARRGFASASSISIRYSHKRGSAREILSGSSPSSTIMQEARRFLPATTMGPT
jgi:hypothetical protein